MTVKLPIQSRGSRPGESASVSRSISDWIARHLAPKARVQMRLRGNILHILCETVNSLHQAGAIARLVDGLLSSDAEVGLLAKAYPQVYQLYIYGRRLGQTKPDWATPIYLNRLERHKAQLQQLSTAPLEMAIAQSSQRCLPAGPTGEEIVSSPASGSAPCPETSHAPATALVLSQVSLAQQGDADAIAWYLSEVLSAFDVAVWVSIRAVAGTVAHPSATSSPPSVSRDSDTANSPSVPGQDTPEQLKGVAATAEVADASAASRLWVFCEAAYSPDPLLIAEPVTERLRQLSLNQFKDAVIVIQVQGEGTPDWSLRIDLTAPEEMLREWGRWGDIAAIERLLTAALSSLTIRGAIAMTDMGLHITVRPATSDGTLPEQADVLAAIEPLLTRLAPQGIHQARVEGQPADSSASTGWISQVDLPAQEHPNLAASTHQLAQRGDLPALTYLLTRLMNPDLDSWLATGGIRIQVLQRDKLLHIMADAPVCPPRRQVVPASLDFLTGLDLTGVEGVRLYGRRAGQLRPTWSYGHDFQSRPGLIPSAEPSFAASETYLGDLLTAVDTPEPDTEARPTPPTEAQQRRWSWQPLRRWLKYTQLWVDQHELPRKPFSLPAADRRDVLTISTVWGLVGLLLALQADWLLGHVVSSLSAVPAPAQTATEAASPAGQSGLPPSPLETQTSPSDEQTSLASRPAENSFALGESLRLDDPADGTTGAAFVEVFGDGTTQPWISFDELLSDSPYASFKSQQLDKKLALYHQHLHQRGPADVLILGSSRALRGVDPTILHRELAALGFGNLEVFNFGINGATAQVVELMLRRILDVDQLPRLILWADGARAFNSGRTDITYNAIATSEGYRTLIERPRPAPLNEDGSNPLDIEGIADPAAVETASMGDSLRESYQVLDQTLSQELGRWSALYRDRDRLKALLQERLLVPLTAPLTTAFRGASPQENTSDLPIPDGSRMDADGFLALEMQFNPATYYQQYARVAGLYDSDYEDFELAGVQVDAFQRLLRYTQQLNIPMVFVNTPLTDEYLDDYRMEAEAAFRRQMLEFSVTEELFVFRDLGQLWRQRYDYFSDPSHLNRFGAYQVSNRLAQDPMIPWPQARALPAIPEELQP